MDPLTGYANEDDLGTDVVTVDAGDVVAEDGDAGSVSRLDYYKGSSVTAPDFL